MKHNAKIKTRPLHAFKKELSDISAKKAAATVPRVGISRED